jgi:hypothetical protein
MDIDSIIEEEIRKSEETGVPSSGTGNESNYVQDTQRS